MAEPDKRQIGDGSDNYGEAARQVARAARESGKMAADQAAAKGAEAAGNAAAATVQAGVEGGKAVAGVAAGTAVGGPWGAILSAAWSLRHTLFKVLICICLVFLVIIILIVSLPSIVTNSVFGLNGSDVDLENPTTLLESYNDLAADIAVVVEEGYEAALAEVEQIIADGGYDHDLSMDALVNYAQSSAGYDVSYILAAYSASLQQKNTSKEDMLAKLRAVSGSMFPVSSEADEGEHLVPLTYSTYKSVTLTAVTQKTQIGSVNGSPIYRYTTARRTYYEPDETFTSSEPVSVTTYTPVTVDIPIYSGTKIIGTRSATYYTKGEVETLSPTTETVSFVECTIHPFDSSVVLTAFGIDAEATYDQFNVTYAEAIQKMASALKMTLYGTLGDGQMVPLTDEELVAFVEAQNCSPMDMYTSECRFQQEAALQSVMPFLKISPELEKKTQRNVLTSGAASSYIFTSFEMSDENGVLLGINRYNNSLCIVDLFNTKINKNANLNLLGTSGAGKTFTMQLLALRMRMRGIQCYILAPIKGHEFRRACNKIGGEFIKIAPGSPHCINIMEIRHTMSPEMELIDEIDYVEMGSMLARKIQQLMTFFGLLIPDMSNEEEQMLDEALIRTYADFGITHDNSSIYTDMSAVPPKMKQMPILGDLHKHLLENPMTQRLAAIISRFVTGSAQSFNRQTNVDLSNKYIVLDLSELKGKLLPVGMFIALDYVWDQIKSDRTKRKAIFIDEIWQLIGAGSNHMAAEFCLEIFKVIRGFGGAAISATQDLSDFFGLEDGKYGRAIINNSKNKIILNLEPDEAQYVQETLKLTRTEIRAITRFERGEALISSNNNKIPVVVKASKLEKEMITTDRAELEAILKERQKRQTHTA